MIVPTGLAARRGYFLIALAIVLADQATKILAHGLLAGRGPAVIVPGLFNLSYSRNPGGLFGYFGDLGDPWRSMLLTLLPVGAIVLIAVFLIKGREADRGTLGGMALILGGAVGNLIDRLFRGEVVDFLDVYASWPPLAEWLIERFGTAHWPTFNIADSAIVCGAGLLLINVFRARPSPAPDRAAGEAERG
jgi:signal peptidase II